MSIRPLNNANLTLTSTPNSNTNSTTSSPGLRTPTLNSPTFPSSPTRSTMRPQSPTRSNSSLDKISVNVSVRIRPPLEQVADPTFTTPGSPLRKKQSNSGSVIESTTNNSVTIKNKKYAFDNVFDEITNQQDIWNYVGPCVTKVVQGYNVTIMAYGQSGSGKSYTMGTSEDPNSVKDHEIMGITQRSASTLFNELKRSTSSSPGLGLDIDGRGSPTPLNAPRLRPPSMSFSSKNRLMNGIDENIDCQPFTISVSFMEIYNEQLRDLLDPTNLNKKMTIREDVKGNIIVQNIKEIVVPDTESLLATLEQGSKARQTNSTAINAQSSRSHAIFTIKLIQKQLNPENGIVTTITSKLNLVDLAGSERLKNTGAATEGRVREGISINSGLTSLGKVISQLSLNSNGNGHVSYRDSKLTRALQDSLGGKAITYLIACITTEPLYAAETLNTLSYAQRARSIQSTPEIQTASESSKEDLIRTVANLQQELQFYKKLESTNTSPLLSGGNSFAPFSPSTPSDNSISNVLASPSSSESSKERVSRSTAFQSAVESIIQDYEATVKSLQESCRISRESHNEMEMTIQQIKAELVEAQDANYELGDLVEQLQQRIEELLNETTNDKHKDNNNDYDDNDDDELKRNELKITQLEKELVAYRQEQKRHSIESQYLTSQYNNARQEATKLQKDKEELEAKLRKLESSQTTTNMFRRRVSVPDIPDVAEEDDSINDTDSNNSFSGPETPPSSSNPQLFKSHFSFADTKHRRTLSLASSSSTSTEKTPRSERRKSSFFVRASVM